MRYEFKCDRDSGIKAAIELKVRQGDKGETGG